MDVQGGGRGRCVRGRLDGCLVKVFEWVRREEVGGGRVEAGEHIRMLQDSRPKEQNRRTNVG